MIEERSDKFQRANRALENRTERLFYTPPFHICGLSEGFPRISGQDLLSPSRYLSYRENPEVRDEMVNYHKMLFSLIYGLPIQLEEDDTSEVIRQIADLIALADYYWLLPAIACQLETLLLDLPFFWKDVAEFPLLDLAIGHKLRSSEIFSDAIRHFVGSGGTPRLVADSGVLKPAEAAAALMPSLECLRHRTEGFIKSIRRIAFTQYQAPHDRARGHQDPPVGTFWLAATFPGKGKTLKEVCEWIADSHWREFWEVHLSGTSHWSHIKNKQNRGSDGNVELGSLRKACQLLRRAWLQRSNINILGRNLAQQYAAIFNLHLYPRGKGDPAPEEIITDRLKSHIRLAHPELAAFLPQSSGAFCSRLCSRIHEPAKHDQGLSYFTTMAVDKQEFPWARLPEWKELKMPDVDLKGASEEWIQAVMGTSDVARLPEA